MRSHWPRFELRVKLTGDEERVIFEFDYFGNLLVRAGAAEYQTFAGDSGFVFAVDSVAMAMALLYQRRFIERGGQRFFGQTAGQGPKAHFAIDAAGLLAAAKQGDHRADGVELG